MVRVKSFSAESDNSIRATLVVIRCMPSSISQVIVQMLSKVNLAWDARDQWRFDQLSPTLWRWQIFWWVSRDLGDDLFFVAGSQVPGFWEAFNKFSSMVNVKSAMSYYNRDMCLTGNRDIVHCTAKFCGIEKSGFQASHFGKFSSEHFWWHP